MTLPPWLHWLDRCPSTNTWALDRLPTLQHGDVVFTPQQTAGRGQHGRIWYAPPGGLTASFVLDAIPAAQLPGLSLAAGLAVVYAIEDLLPELQNELRLKWSNDVILDGGKLAGILCEGVTQGATQETKVVVGVGLNRCVGFAQAGIDARSMGNPISLHQVVATVPNQEAILTRLRHYLLETAGLLRSTSGFAALLPTLRQRDWLVGKPIAIQQGQEQICGIAAGIDDRGCLLLKLADGTIRAFASGHILLQDKQHDKRFSDLATVYPNENG